MMKDENETYYKVYGNPKHWNVVFHYMASHMTDAKFGQLVNFGVSEKAKIANAEAQLKQLLDDGSVKHVDDDLYQVSPYIVGNGDWDDIYNLREIYDEEKFDELYKIAEYTYTRRAATRSIMTRRTTIEH